MAEVASDSAVLQSPPAEVEPLPKKSLPLPSPSSIFSPWSASWWFFIVTLSLRLAGLATALIFCIIALFNPVFDDGTIDTYGINIHGWIAISCFSLIIGVNIITNFLLLTNRSLLAYEREMTVTSVSCVLGGICAAYLIVPAKMASHHLCKDDFRGEFWENRGAYAAACSAHLQLTVSATTASFVSLVNFAVALHSYYTYFQVYGGLTGVKYILNLSIVAVTVVHHSVFEAMGRNMLRAEYEDQHQLLLFLLLINGYMFGVMGIISIILGMWAVLWRSKVILLWDFVMTMITFVIMVTCGTPLLFWCRDLIHFFCDLSTDSLTVIGPSTFNEKEVATATCNVSSTLWLLIALTVITLLLTLTSWIIALSGLAFWVPAEWKIMAKVYAPRPRRRKSKKT